MPRRPGRPSPAQCDRTPLPKVHLSRDHSRAVVAARVRAGHWVQVRPGAYVDVDPQRPDHQRLEHQDGRRRLALARIVAIRSQLAMPYYLSHCSAALLWGLPLLEVPGTTHVIQASRPRAGRADDIVRHVHRLPERQRTVHRGHPTTTVERTIVDCAMSLPLLSGLVVADAGLHIGADAALCREILGSLGGRRGAPAARTVLEHADDGAESPGETAARLALVQAGLPVPETQILVRTPAGDFWSDLGWRHWRLLVEYDGRGKYRSGAEPAATIVAEKRRQGALEEAGWRVIRLVNDDLRDPGTLVRRVAAMAPPGAVETVRRRSLLVA